MSAMRRILTIGGGEEERKAIEPLLKETRFCQDLEDKAFSYAVEDLVPQHLLEVKQRREELIAKTMDAVKDRLTKEINYWDHRANELKEQELAGKVNARINSAKARQRADDLEARLQKRMAELEQERRLSPLPPVVIGGALVVPRGFVDMATGTGKSVSDDPLARAEIEQMAMKAVMEAERALGYEPVDVSAENRGYDIESKIPGTGKLRFIEVKGRAAGSETVTITRNEILTGLNKPEDFILALVEVNGEMARPWYIQRPFGKEPDFGAESVNYSLRDLLNIATEPC